MKDWVAIGRLWRARGNRGELLGELDSPDPEREQKLQQVALDLNGTRQIFEIEEVWRHDGRPVFKFVGIDSISAAEVWQRAEILVPPADVAQPEEGSYSHRDLVGCRVEQAGKPGEVLGTVEAVQEYGGPPLLVVEVEGGREVSIPFARAICREIDIAGKVIRVELPDGLLELP